MKKLIFELNELPPEFRQAYDKLRASGHPADWLLQSVDPDLPTAMFIKGGKPWYLSQCSHYEGYWLDGHIGSVQCKNVAHLLPGHFWYSFCKEKYEACPYRALHR